VTLAVTGPVQETLLSLALLALEVRRRLSLLLELRDVVIHLKDPSPELEIRAFYPWPWSDIKAPSCGAPWPGR